MQKNKIEELVQSSLSLLQQEGVLPKELGAKSIQIDRTKDASHGDFASNIALVLSKAAKSKPRDLAVKIVEKISQQLSDVQEVEKVEIAGPGFINFFFAAEVAQQVVSTILTAGSEYGKSNLGEHKKIMLEFVSANPTGPLHVGHGRGAAYGSTLSNLLKTVGFNVRREYYVNDAGRQMDILAVSVWLRYLDLSGVEITFPVNGYQGDYIWDIAAKLQREHRETLLTTVEELFNNVTADELDGGDKEAHIDGLIANAKQLLGDDKYALVHQAGLSSILRNIEQDLGNFGVEFDNWFSENSLMQDGSVANAVERLLTDGYAYKEGNTVWFKSTQFGDEKDRVLVRENGLTTYFASDIAYHVNKLERGYEEIIDIWGADHHGYVARVKAGMTAMKTDQEKLKILLVQFASLFRGGEKVQMSTRSGEFVTLRQLREEVGKDAARFFYVLRRCEQHMDFDLDLAKSQSADNPVYYIQYAHARICSVMKQLQDKGLKWQKSEAEESLTLLTTEHEHELLKLLSKYPELLQNAARHYEPHQLAHYLRELAAAFHLYYNSSQFVVEDAKLRNARIALIQAVRQVIVNGLTILGVSAPEAM